MATDREFLLDVTRLVWRRWSGRLPTGIDRVCLAYLEQFRRDSQAVIQRVGVRRILSETASDRLFDVLLSDDDNVRPGLIAALARPLAVVNRRDGAGRLYLNVGHTGLNDPGLARWVAARRLRPVYMVHDLIPITHSTACRPGEAERHRRRMRAALATATGIIGNSQATLDSLEQFRRAERLPKCPTLAAHLGSDAGGLARPTSSQSDRPTFVILGTIEARKNHAMLLRIWTELVTTFGDQAPRLLVIGQRGWECADVLKLLDSGALGASVVEIGRCGDDALAGHLADARALLFPSLAEGYGLPLVEALRHGAPVIASDIPVFREIGQGVPDFLSPADPDAWRRAILAYATPDSPERAAQLTRLACFRPSSWQDHFAAVRDWLGRL